MNIMGNVMRLESKVIEYERWSLIPFLVYTCLLYGVKRNNFIYFIVYTNYSNINLINVITKILFYITKITLAH